MRHKHPLPESSEDIPDKKVRFLTEVELEFMTKLWDLGEATVREVQDALGPTRKLAYTSAATILRILEQKGFVTSAKQSVDFHLRTDTVQGFVPVPIAQEPV